MGLTVATLGAALSRELATEGGAGAAEPEVASSVPSVVAAGDIARCGTGADDRTAALLDTVAAGATVVALGDNVYETGTAAEWRDCYDPTWGRFRSRTRPVIGNHEIQAPPYDGSAYYDYFGAAAGPRGKGWYSYDLGDWHVVVLNTNCQDLKDDSCGAGSEQEQWLRTDLAENRTLCTVAMWHHPWVRNPYTQALFEALHDHGVDVLLSGDDHYYERFAPQDPGFQVVAGGVRQFVVGTGGAPLHTPSPGDPASRVRLRAHGVLKLSLHPDRYEWEFVGLGRRLLDSGETLCR